ncbi:agglutinin alpha chain [Morus notabilis]|uniref:agglutinin alpha chain n=1 Tax=Morus notabilis TaxID=981085 RepID=UPI000CED634C|nr:agglutinin alpha chain [Morus notabilis]
MSATTIGPFGGPDGKPWDDGSGHTGVRGIKLTYKGAVGSFRAVYDLNGNPDLGPGHPSGDFSYRPGDAYFNFREGERITGVSGHVGVVPYDPTTTPVVRSIKFTTNENIYGPYGVEEGTPFNAQIPDGAFISGFEGRSNGYYLNSIGFHQRTP